MRVSADHKAYLKNLADRGDMMAQAFLDAVGSETAGGTEKIDTLAAPAAKSTTAVHANVFGDAAGPVSVTTAITNPAVPRNLTATFGATFDGGDVTVSGTDQFGNAITETFAVATGTTVVGSKAFATVTSIAYAGGGVGTHSTNVVSIGTGDKLGLSTKAANAFAILLTDGVSEAVTVDATNSTFTPATVANGAHNYSILYRT